MVYLVGHPSTNNYDPFILTIPQGNYTGSGLASTIQELLNGFAVPFGFEVVYHTARGTISIEAKSEGMDSLNEFIAPSGFVIMTWMSNYSGENPWKDREGNVQAVEINNIKYINGVLRNTEMVHVSTLNEYYRKYETVFLIY